MFTSIDFIFKQQYSQR